jgi:RNA polymerase sigma factor (sigma-70 family)
MNVMILADKTSHHNLPLKSAGVDTSSDRPLSRGVTGADYFYSDEFADEGAGESLMAVMPPAKQTSQRTPPSGLPSYLAYLWTIPVLNQVQEQHCFRKLNYLKFLLANESGKRSACAACQELQGDVEALQESIVRTRNSLVESNLRLVVSIAKRHSSSSIDLLDELVCIGNAALMRAVDLFDYRRGNRFSTYAYQAIERAMFGAFRRDQRYRSKVTTAGEGVLEFCPGDAGESDRAELEAEETLSKVTELIKQLDDRDQYIVMSRFGMNRAEPGVAFHVIAKEIQLSTTRTVQRFNRSLETMRLHLTKRNAGVGMRGQSSTDVVSNSGANKAR